MLVVKVSVNGVKEVEEIHIHNVSDTNNGMTKYKIEKPELPEDYAYIWHIRENGYIPLLIDALESIWEYREIDDPLQS